jgi:hypothetical protein
MLTKLLPALPVALALLLAACTQKADPSAPPKASSAEGVSSASKPASNADEGAADTPLKAGHVVFQGMVRPTKAGYDVRGVVIEGDLLPKALANAPGADAKNTDWFLGAIVRIDGELRKHEAHPKKDDGIIVQMRSGAWDEVVRIDSATVVKPAEVIEGSLKRSKGFFSVGGRLVTPDDLAWSLAPDGGREGDQVRLFGQPRTVVCEPNAQCLIEGSLPLFDVGRAERVR